MQEGAKGSCGDEVEEPDDTGAGDTAASEDSGDANAKDTGTPAGEGCGCGAGTPLGLTPPRLGRPAAYSAQTSSVAECVVGT